MTRQPDMLQLDLFRAPPPPPFESYSRWFINAEGREVCMHVDSPRGYGFHRWCGHRIGPGRCLRAVDGLPVETCPRHAEGYKS